MKLSGERAMWLTLERDRPCSKMDIVLPVADC
jgi:hypothetical protein